MAPIGNQIELRGVRVHNLKEIDLDIPHGQFVSICGISGSGKSSLAFDTLYAEGQRRYLESLSSWSRQFLTQLDRPDADRIDGIPPAIAIQAHRHTASSPGSELATVGTSSEIIEYLRLLMSRIGIAYCPDCQIPIGGGFESAITHVDSIADGARYLIASEIDVGQSAREFEAAIANLKAGGFRRVVIGEQTMTLDQIESTAEVESILVIVDRLTGGSEQLSRARESLETAFNIADVAWVLVETKQDAEAKSVQAIDGRSFRAARFGEGLSCSQCQQSIEPPQPQSFSFNSPLGACADCSGTGNSEVLGLLCESCGGTRLNKSALAFRIGEMNIAEMCRMEIREAVSWFEELDLAESKREIGAKIMQRVNNQLVWLQRVGLGYLTLDRPSLTLSSGEAQRVLLSKVLGSTLTDMLYVLDEPSAGLHAADAVALAETVRELNQRGNTVVIVDHNRDLILSAGRIIEIGPGAGEDGGTLVFDGNAKGLVQSRVSTTGEYLSHQRGLRSPDAKRRNPDRRIRIEGASRNNLRAINVEFPLGCMCVVTGVSGSGKSSLVQQTLYLALADPDASSSDPSWQSVSGYDHVDEVVLVDESPIGRSSRSNPVTYVKAFDEIRKAFAETTGAKAAGFKPGHFSFNVAGGRCEACRGEGWQRIDMQFLGEMSLVCDQCGGARFGNDVLAIEYRARNISDVLAMTVREAFGFFRGKRKLQEKLKSLIDVGLDYLRLGQPASTLSSGEAQRLKLAHYLNAPGRRRVLFLLDEPTRGLHMRDVVKLVDCLESLVAAGHSLIIVEHNLQLIKHADWVIDLGPGAAGDGGTVVVAGTPEQIADCWDSATGKHLVELFRAEAESMASL